MKRSMDYGRATPSRLPVVLALILGIILVAVTVSAAPEDDVWRSTPTHSLTPSPRAGVGLPGRRTATPAHSPIGSTASVSPQITSPFVFPTARPTFSPTPAVDCTAFFPLDNVSAIDFGVTTLIQLEASFGRATYQGGRAPRYRFEEQGCVLVVTVGFDEVFDAELQQYGTLGLLLDWYGEPAAVGISQGNLTLLDIGRAVLFYPEVGVIALFEVAPDDLVMDTTINKLIFRAPFELDRQVVRLNVRVIEWDAAFSSQ